MTITLSHGGDTIFASSSPSDEILVGTKEGIACLKRDQGGSNWRIDGRWLTDKHIHALITEPLSGTIFAGVYQDTVYASEDGGRSWERRGEGLTVPNMYCLAAARMNGSARIFAGTEPAHLFCSDDLGHSWSELTALRSVDMSAWTFPLEPFDAHTKHITVHPDDPNTLFIGIEQGGLLKSTDGGETFTALPGMDDDVHRTVIDPLEHGQGLPHRRGGHLCDRGWRSELGALHDHGACHRRLPRVHGRSPALCRHHLRHGRRAGPGHLERARHGRIPHIEKHRRGPVLENPTQWIAGPAEDLLPGYDVGGLGRIVLDLCGERHW